MSLERRFQCPCCDHFTLGERRSFEVCPICAWEDDGQDLDELDLVSTPNHITLPQGRSNFQSFGASDQSALGLVARPEERDGVRRELRTI